MSLVRDIKSALLAALGVTGFAGVVLLWILAGLVSIAIPVLIVLALIKYVF